MDEMVCGCPSNNPHRAGCALGVAEQIAASAVGVTPAGGQLYAAITALHDAGLLRDLDDTADPERTVWGLLDYLWECGLIEPSDRPQSPVGVSDRPLPSQVSQLAEAATATSALEAELSALREQAAEWRAHSINFNAVAYRLAEALADRKGLDHYVGNPIEQAERVIRERDQAQAKVERWRVELREKRNDLLDVWGLLSPNGGTRIVPPDIDIGDRVAPAVEWLIGQRERATRELGELRAAVATVVEAAETAANVLDGPGARYCYGGRDIVTILRDAARLLRGALGTTP